MVKGYIRKKSPGSFQVSIDAGRDPATGARKQIWETIKGTREDAERRLAEIAASLDQGGFIKHSRISLGEWLLDWHENWVLSNLKKQTADSYAMEIRNHLIPRLGSVPLQQLTPRHLRDYIKYALEEGRSDNEGGLSAATVRYHMNIIRGSLRQAIVDGYVTRNVVDSVDLPRIERPAIDTLKREQVPRFLAAAKGNYYYALFYTALFTGMRLGELLGLRWCDTALGLGYISVVRSLYKRGSECEFTEPKSRSSRRRILLSASLVEVLREHRREQEADGRLLGRPLEDKDLVFAYPGNKPLDPGTVTHAFGNVLKSAGLPHLRFHDLRHTHITLLLEAGVHPKVVSERAGHSSVAFTLDTYSHVMPTIQQVAAERLDKFLFTENVAKNDTPNQSWEYGRRVAKMLPKRPWKVFKRREFEREPHRNRTCNLLIKSQLLCQLS